MRLSFWNRKKIRLLGQIYQFSNFPSYRTIILHHVRLDNGMILLHKVRVNNTLRMQNIEMEQDDWMKVSGFLRSYFICKYSIEHLKIIRNRKKIFKLLYPKNVKMERKYKREFLLEKMNIGLPF